MILRNCKLIAELCEPGAPEMADVVIEGSRIQAVLPCGTPVKGEHEIMDLYGATLLPGLIDAHVHLFMGKGTDGDRDRITVPAQWAFDCYSYARFFLDNGYTTIRDVGDELHFSGLATRNAINEGIMKGPRIYGSGVTIVPVTAGFDSYGYFCAFYSTKDDVRKEARNQFNHGADFLKLYGTGSMMVDDSLPGKRIMLEDEIAEAVMIAKSKGSYCACHCHGAEAIGVMISQGVRTIEHASFITNESCKKLDGRKDIGIVPTIACSCPESMGLTEKDGAVYEKFSSVSAQRDACLRNAYENYDILIGWGTDMALYTMEANPYIEWQARKERLGITNIDLLKQATINSAVLMGIDHKTGSVSAGKFADLIVIDGDPAADITAMYQKPLHVIKEGEVIR